jgi:hypothetical protein
MRTCHSQHHTSLTVPYCLLSLALFACTQVFGAETDAPPLFDSQNHLIIPVRVHLLMDEGHSQFHTSLNAEDITRIFRKVNRVWNQAGLSFSVEGIDCEKPAHSAAGSHPDIVNEQAKLLNLRSTSNRTANCFHIYYIKEMSVNGFFTREAIFVKDTASLRDVKGGIDEPLPRVTSHELGHALGLVHRQNQTNLMASGTTGISLNAAEIAVARRAAAALPWIKVTTTPRPVADALSSDDK